MPEESITTAVPPSDQLETMQLIKNSILDLLELPAVSPMYRQAILQVLSRDLNLFEEESASKSWSRGGLALAIFRSVSGASPNHEAERTQAAALLGAAVHMLYLAADVIDDVEDGDYLASELAMPLALNASTGLPIFRLFGLSADRTPLTSLTIGLDSPEVMAQKAQAARAFPILKVKLGTDHDLEIIRAIREVSGATIRVDANAGWTPEQAIRIMEEIAPYDIQLVEQPVYPADLEGLRLVREHAPMPVFADESCVTVADIPRLADCVDGINIELMKCGGLRQALKMIHVARAHGLQIMLGCMVESAIAITAAAHLSPLVDYADLDGNLMIEADPYAGVRVANGKLILPDTPGLGITEQEHIAEDL